jgi:hypothetical protein
MLPANDNHRHWGKKEEKKKKRMEGRRNGSLGEVLTWKI